MEIIREDTIFSNYTENTHCGNDGNYYEEILVRVIIEGGIYKYQRMDYISCDCLNSDDYRNKWQDISRKEWLNLMRIYNIKW